MKGSRAFAACALAALAGACSTVYYSTLEKVGVHKREILVDRVAEARDSQKEAKRQFVDALEQFRSVVRVKGGDLEEKYARLGAALKESEAEAERVHDRIAAVEDVAEALFAEWRKELGQYSDQGLRRSSQEKLDLTRARYAKMIAAMRKAEAAIAPVLTPLRDQVLYLKHNLNAKAIAALDDELLTVQAGVGRLLKEMEASIAEADRFIKSLDPR